MQCNVVNVKVSIKIEAPLLNIVQEQANNNNLFSKLYNNYLVVKAKYTYIIFKPNKNKNHNHINITKIPNTKFVTEAISEIENLLKVKHFDFKIDNIVASGNFMRHIDILEIVKKRLFEKIKYNNQKFPGLFIKFNRGTAIIFHSGKVVLVGCKDLNDIEWITQQLVANI